MTTSRRNATQTARIHNSHELLPRILIRRNRRNEPR